MKHTCIAITTCAAFRSTFTTLIYNTYTIHLKYLKHTIATCTFIVASACYLDEWRLVDIELDTGMELNATKWREGRRCGGRQRHGSRRGSGWNVAATGDASGRAVGHERGPSRRRGSQRAGDATGQGCKESGRLIGPSVRPDDL
jgi:hypothetical protein